MAKVFSVQSIEFKPGVTDQDVEKWAAELNSLPPLEWEWYVAKGDKGSAKGKYAVVLVMDSEVRDRYFGSPSGKPGSVQIPAYALEW